MQTAQIVSTSPFLNCFSVCLPVGIYREAYEDHSKVFQVKNPACKVFLGFSSKLFRVEEDNKETRIYPTTRMDD